MNHVGLSDQYQFWDILWRICYSMFPVNPVNPRTVVQSHVLRGPHTTVITLYISYKHSPRHPLLSLPTHETLHGMKNSWQKILHEKVEDERLRFFHKKGLRFPFLAECYVTFNFFFKRIVFSILIIVYQSILQSRVWYIFRTRQTLFFGKKSGSPSSHSGYFFWSVFLIVTKLEHGTMVSGLFTSSSKSPFNPPVIVDDIKDIKA